MKNAKIRSFLAMALAGAMLIGCAGGNTGQLPAIPNHSENSAQAETAEAKTEQEPEQAPAATETPESAATEETQTAQETETDPHIAALLNDWEYVYTMYTSRYGYGGDYTSCSMATDDYALQIKIRFREENNVPYVDYICQGMEGSERLYGLELEYNTGAAYENCPNSEWYYVMKDPFGDEYGDPMKITVTDDGKLIVASEYKEEATEEYDAYYSVSAGYFLPADSPLLENIDDLRYFDTVTVDNPVDLMQNIGNNKKIILKPGTYNISDVSSSQINNSAVTLDYDEYVISASNLALEAESGDVLICIGDPYSPVLNFEYCSNIKLSGLTVGHDVEPGYCSGSVLKFDGVSTVDIGDCHLYGCGTYGVEAYSTYDMNVHDTEIYECTYGLVDLDSVGSVYFKNCVMRDSKELSMINVNGSYDVIFEDCTFSNNDATAYDVCYFVELGEYDSATFRRCNFSNNKYYTFSNKEVVLEDCVDDNNNTGLENLMNNGSTVSVSDLKDEYKSASELDSETEEKLNSDSLLDQATINQLTYDVYEAWDSLLNHIWSYLLDTLPENEMEKLTKEEMKWIKEKEKAVKDAAAPFEGGSMQAMIENTTATGYTKARVDVLMDTYI